MGEGRERERISSDESACCCMTGGRVKWGRVNYGGKYRGRVKLGGVEREEESFR